MSSQLGRPATGSSKKDIRLQLRLNKEEIARIDNCAKILKTSRTDVVNKGVRILESQLVPDEKE
ncbi:MAG: CopG family transcriptional regulator [Clostridiales bacterium]|nr:CopG family transcriptional regulator [Clostridiales bacterium]